VNTYSLIRAREEFKRFKNAHLASLRADERDATKEELELIRRLDALLTERLAVRHRRGMEE
jgi:hypothetical protein